MDYGLTTADVITLQRKFGPNTLTAVSRFSPIKLFLAQFTTFLNAIMFVAAIFSLYAGDRVDAGFIGAIIVLNAIIGFIQEYKAEKSLEKLKNYTVQAVRVIRNGKEVQLSSTLLVPGDIVILSEGDRIPADGELIESHHFESDESILTGESLPVMKQLHDEIYMGMLTTKGKGTMRVTTIGKETRFGAIAQTLADITDDKTPMQKQLDTLSRVITLIVLFFAFLLIPLGLFRGEALLPLLFLATSIGVAAIPISLPAVITIALAIGTGKMAKRHAIVRKMPAIETLGSIQFILVDKTGTLTQNQMRVKKHSVEKKEQLSHLLKACVLGNTASLIQKGSIHQFDIVGDRTDGALLLFAQQENEDIKDDIRSGKVIDEYVFDSKYRTVTTIWEKRGRRMVYTRGAPEAILERSTLSDKEKKEVEAQITEYAASGLRVIGFGSKDETRRHPLTREQAEEDVTFLGIVGIYDAPRPEVKHAVSIARGAGIQPIMVTGDNELTALSIAKEIGLIENDEDVLTGEEIEAYSDEELFPILLKTRVFARTKPEHKLRLTALLKKNGYVVGVTGDGVNDALALKKADVGVSMGETGTDVAKEASDIIIADDNFATIIRAVAEGRTIYYNIVKAITYLLAGNLSEIALICIASFLNMPSPLLPTQILWINLVTDGLPALALASDITAPHILRQPPRNPKTPILTKNRSLFIVGMGLGMAVLFLVTFSVLLQSHSISFARTVVFNLLIVMHMGVALLVRGQSPFRANKLLLLTILFTLLLQLLITTVPVFQNIFHLEL